MSSAKSPDYCWSRLTILLSTHLAGMTNVQFDKEFLLNAICIGNLCDKTDLHDIFIESENFFTLCTLDGY